MTVDHESGIASSPRPGGRGFDVLFVCTGNIGRSPMAERLAARRFAGLLVGGQPVTLHSAGTWAQPGDPMEPHAAEALRELGAIPDGFVATELTEDVIGVADLVLTATAEHRAAVAARSPVAVQRTFTLGEFARFGEHLLRGPLPPDPHQRVALALAVRGQLGAAAGDDVADPYGQSAAVYRACARQIDAAVSWAVALLTAA